jgi:hypothetical protein
MKKIIYTRPDGGISVIHPVINTSETMRITEAGAEQRAFAQLPLDAINPRWIDDSIIPLDRTFRNAWEDIGGSDGIKVNMPKAREIHKNKLRVLREPLLKELDADYMRADEQEKTAEKDRIAIKKQTLRDITDNPVIEAAQTPDQLKAIGIDINGIHLA